MEKKFFARLFSPWDQLPLVAVIALVFIYMATKGQMPPLVVFEGVGGNRYMSPENLWNEAVLIGGFTWGLLFIMSGSLSFFARDEADGILSILEPIRGMIPTGIMALFFGLLTSLTRGHIWINIGLGLFVVCTIVGLIISLKKMPQLTPLNDANTELLSSARWYSGYFCVCKEDPRVLVPRRSGSGIALNLAHGRAWGVLLVGMVLPLTLAIVASFGGLF
jgi:hypothetical protein